MTNEEKAKEICGGNFIAFNKEFSAALQMAEWKDHQFKEYLEKKLKIAEELVKKPQNDILQVRAAGMFNQIHEIINELFKEK